ncbi:MAG: hypothetical protein AB7D57_13225 [Desulfovibrionaceae bacterium]
MPHVPTVPTALPAALPAAASLPAAPRRPLRPASRLGLALALLAALALALPERPARAMSAEDQRNICLCTRVMARILCKKVDEFNYVDSYSDGTYSFSVFYADQVRPIRCQVSESFVHLKADLGQIMLRSVPYTLDKTTGCGTLDYRVPQCPDTSIITCCGKRSAEDLQKEEELKFWNKPIPELLQQELQKGIATDQNGTTEPAQPPASQPGQ